MLSYSCTNRLRVPFIFWAFCICIVASCLIILPLASPIISIFLSKALRVFNSALNFANSLIGGKNFLFQQWQCVYLATKF